jgi:hypothetical protein
MSVLLRERAATPPELGEAAGNGAVFELNEKEKDTSKDWAPAIPLHLQGEAPSTRLRQDPNYCCAK